MSRPLVMDGCDSAILGYVEDNQGQLLVIYGEEELQAEFEAQFAEDDDPAEVAREWINFNIAGAYVGPGTPLILYRADREAIDTLAEELADD
jgi:hypothetical protein